MVDHRGEQRAQQVELAAADVDEQVLAEVLARRDQPSGPASNTG
jgi:hypothetical protein